MLTVASLTGAKRWRETECLSTDEQPDIAWKEHPHGRAGASLKEEGGPDTCPNVDGPRGHDAESNELDTKGHILHDPTSMRSLEEIHRDRK